MVEAGTAAIAIASAMTIATFILLFLAYRNAVRRGATRQEKNYMLIGMVAALVICFGFWSVFAIMAIWFVVNIMGF